MQAGERVLLERHAVLRAPSLSRRSKTETGCGYFIPQLFSVKQGSPSWKDRPGGGTVKG